MSPSSSSGKPEVAGERVFLSLGSNIGARETSVLEAASALASVQGIEIAGVSPLFETDPEGDGYSGPFINAVILLKTTMTPESLLIACQEVEQRLGRKKEAREGDRIIDIDIIDFGGRLLGTEDLVLPHPRAAQRSFVLVPLRCLDPGFIFPGTSRSVSDILGDVMVRAGVRKISSRREIPIELFK